MFEISRASFPNKKLHVRVIERVLPRAAIFIHGNAASSRWWEPSLEIWKHRENSVASAGPKAPAILIDLPGCGESQNPDSIEELRPETLAKDLLVAIQSLNLPARLIVGHSAGGLLAAYMLSQSPQSFDRALLLDPVGAHGLHVSSTTYAVYDRMRTDRELTAQIIAATIYKCDAEAEFFKNVLLADALRAMKGLGSYLVRSMDALNSSEIFRAITIPVLVIHGEKDVLLPVAESLEVVQLMQNAKLQVLPETGHCLNVEDPHRFVELASAFLFSATL